MDIAKKYADLQFGTPVACVFANAKSKSIMLREIQNRITILRTWFRGDYSVVKLFRSGNGEQWTSCGPSAYSIAKAVYGDDYENNMYDRTMEYAKGIFRFTYYDHPIVNASQEKYFEFDSCLVYPSSRSFSHKDLLLLIKERQHILKANQDIAEVSNELERGI